MLAFLCKYSTFFSMNWHSLLSSDCSLKYPFSEYSIVNCSVSLPKFLYSHKFLYFYSHLRLMHKQDKPYYRRVFLIAIPSHPSTNVPFILFPFGSTTTRQLTAWSPLNCPPFAMPTTFQLTSLPQSSGITLPQNPIITSSTMHPNTDYHPALIHQPVMSLVIMILKRKQNLDLWKYTIRNMDYLVKPFIFNRGSRTNFCGLLWNVWSSVAWRICRPTVHCSILYKVE